MSSSLSYLVEEGLMKSLVLVLEGQHLLLELHFQLSVLQLL